MRCCGNCEWSFSPEEEEAILEEMGYEEDDPTRPRAGDCAIGQTHDDNFYCPSHLYCDGTEETYLMYDENYMGQGYLIIQTVNDEITKFIKISSFGEGGFPTFSIRGYEEGLKDNLDKPFTTISITVKREESLFVALNKLARNLKEEKMYSIDPYFQGKSNLMVKSDEDSVTIIINKDILGVRNSTDFIDITLGDEYSCKFYNELLLFYNALSSLPIKNTNDEYIKKLLLTK